MKAIVIGAGSRGRAYSKYSELYPNELEIVGVVEPNKERRELFSSMYNIKKENVFTNYYDLFKKDKLADSVFICTLDHQHTEPTLLALEKGYDVLLEKPMSISEKECKLIVAKSKETNRVLTVCHVLRYTPFYRKIKQLIDDGKVGDIVSIMQIENVAYWHHAHSFVRGNWSNTKTSAPMILAKSCHDMDILLYLIQDAPTYVSSFGSLKHFTIDNAPKDSKDRCINKCKVDCPYDARKIYLGDNIEWPVDVITTDLSLAGRTKALKEGPYGKCVYRCNNNVVDRQVVNLEFASGQVASFTIAALATDHTRELKIIGTKGQIAARMDTNEIYLTENKDDKRQKIQVDKVERIDEFGHGGGDLLLVKDFIEAVKSEKENQSSAEISLLSHLICFKAEESRLNHTTIMV